MELARQTRTCLRPLFTHQLNGSRTLIVPTGRRLYSKHTTTSADDSSVTLEHFREAAFDCERPLLLPQGFVDIPAISKWFIRSAHPKSPDPAQTTLNHGYLSFRGGSTIVPLELISQNDENGQATFTRLERPLSDFLAYVALREQAPPNAISKTSLYLAQYPLTELPAPLQADLPPPKLVTDAGRGDIYASSLWLGFAPTATPLHRDPNPNLLVQLCGRKRVRLLSPDLGNEVFREIRRSIGQSAQGATTRGDEMMVGDERTALEKWLWQPDGGFERAHSKLGDEELWEGSFESGGAVFIPKGWWHGVRGEGNGVNGSANWWFR